MTLRFGLKETTIQKVCSVLARYPQVDKAILYGSRAKGDCKHGSDIDLTLLGGDELTLDSLFRIMTEIDDLLLPYSIDLSIFHQIGDGELIDQIRRVGVVFYERATETNRA